MSRANINTVFLVGAGRSGSTLLYKILSMHTKVGFISNYNNVLPQWLPSGYLNRCVSPFLKLKRAAWFEKSGNAHGFRRRYLNHFVPSPVEGENVYARAGVPLFDCAIAKLDKSASPTRFRKALLTIAEHQQCDVMLSKRVSNNRRIPWLKKAFPDACYIHLIRDGRDVAQSFTKVGWWNNDSKVWWSGLRLYEMLEAGWSALGITAQTWVEAVEIVEKNLESIPKGKVLQVRYEELLCQPRETIHRICVFMGIEFDEAYASQIDTLALKPVKAKWEVEWNEEELEVVMKQQYDLLKQLLYL